MIYAKFLIVVILVFVVLRSSFKLYLKLVTGAVARKRFLQIYPVAEIFLWIGIGYWLLNELFGESSFHPLLMGSIAIVVVAAGAWYFLRDFIAGIILKSEHALEPGMRIITSLCSGKITNVGMRSLELLSESGETVRVPYTLLSHQVLITPAPVGKWVQHVMKLRISSALSAEELSLLTKRYLLEMPWVVSTLESKVVLSYVKEGEYEAEISFHVISAEMALKTEQQLKLYFPPIA